MTAKNILSFLLGILPFCLFSQTSTDTLLQWWFPVDVGQTIEIHEGHKIPDDWVWDFDGGHAFPHDLQEDSILHRLDKGQYIKVRMDDGRLANELVFNTNLGMEILQDGKRAALIILDGTGQPTEADLVQSRGKTLEYDLASQSYPIKKPKDMQVVMIQLRGQVEWYKLEEVKKSRYYGSGWRKFKATKIGRFFIARPKWFFVRTGRKIRNLFIYDREERREQRINQNHPDYNGYIALNKPKYLPGDSLKLKAYFVKRKSGKRLKKPVRLIIKERGWQADTIYQTTLRPEEAGRYVFDFVLGDSLTLDKHYELQFLFGKRGYQRWIKQFYLEEYELDDVEYTFEVKNENGFRKDERVILKADAKFTTGKRVPDAEMRLVVLSGKIHKLLRDSVVIPDTIWTHRQSLNYTDATQIIIPDSLLPPAEMDLSAYAYFNTSDGELQDKTVNFRINNKASAEYAGDLFLEYENGKIKGRLEKEGKSIEAEGILEISEPQGVRTKRIKLPFEEAYNPFANRYVLQYKGQFETLYINKNTPNQLDVISKRSTDSIYIKISNPLGIPCMYSLHYGKGTIARGLVADSLVYHAKVKGKEAYSLSYGYVWGGKAERLGERIFRENPNLLSLEIEQPDELEPGAQTQVKITAKTPKGKPVKGVELVAAAVSSKFGKDLNKAYETPKIQGIKSKSVKTSASFNCDYLNTNRRLRSSRISAPWVERMNLMEGSDYRFRFPEGGLHMEYIPLPEGMDSLPRFVPLVVQDGRYIPAYSLHYDRMPIYYHDAYGSPYSFIGTAGEHNLRFRGENFSLELPNIPLKAGHQLIISMDLDSAKVDFSNGIAYRKKTNNEWDVNERYEREKHLMSVRMHHGEEYHIWRDGGRAFSLRNQSGDILIGPFPHTDSVNVIKQYEFMKKMDFDAGFNYRIEPNRERLYHLNLRESKEIGNARQRIAFHEFSILGDSIRFQAKREEHHNPLARYFDLQYYKKGVPQEIPGFGEVLHLDYQGESPLIIVLVRQGREFHRFHAPQKRFFEDLPKGNYRVFLIFKDGYLSKDIAIKPQHNSYLHITDTPPIQEGFQEKVMEAFGEGFDFEKSIFTKNPEIILGMEDILKQKQRERLERERRQQVVYTGPTHRVTGIVTGESGEPLIGANVMVSGYAIGTVTDFDGSYSLDVPVGNDVEIVISYIGYNETSTPLNGRNVMDISMEESALLLEEVSITTASLGFKKSKLSASVTTLEMTGLGVTADRLSERVPGVQITGTASTVQIRGSNSIHGNNQPLIIINGVVANNDIRSQIDPNTISEVAVLQGEQAAAIYGASAMGGAVIITLKQGEQPSILDGLPPISEFELRSEFSDYAYWQPRLVTDRNGEAYFSATIPDDITGWQTFVLGMDRRKRAGIAFDSFSAYKRLMAELSVPRFAVQGDTFHIVGQSINYTRDSFAVSTSFAVNGQPIQQQIGTIKDAITEQAEIIVPQGIDSLQFEYKLSTADYGDGEERSIPVKRQGTTEHSGVFRIFTEKGELDYKRQHNGTTTVRIQDSRMDMLLESVEYLKNYKFGCAEQTASKLIALLLEKDLYAKIGREFKDDKRIKEGISRLKIMQNGDGSWGWWKGNKGINWITLYVIEALQMAEKAGFPSEPLEKGLDYIATSNQLERPAYGLKAMRLLLNDGTPVDSLRLASFDTLKLPAPDFLLLNRVRQLAGHQVDLDSIDRMMASSTHGGKFVNSGGGYWYYNNTNTTLIAYDIYKAAGREDMTKGIEIHLVQNRGHRGWRNTIHAAQILSRLLSDSRQGEAGRVFVNGKQVTKFPYVQSFEGDNVSIKKEGGGTHFVSVSEEYHVTDPVEKSDVFQVRTHFEQEDKRVDILQKSMPTKLIATIHAKQKGDYVMLEIPIPAGCSYGNKIQDKSWGSVEVHREYFKDKVVIFCTKLPVGEHRFIIELEPRYTGRFILNPLRVEEMYAPSVFGRNEVKKARISGIE